MFAAVVPTVKSSLSASTKLYPAISTISSAELIFVPNTTSFVTLAVLIDVSVSSSM